MERRGGTLGKAIGSAEFTLAVECCRRCFRKAPTRDEGLVPDGIDWDQFLRLVRFHRIEGLAWNSLAGFPGVAEPARCALKDAASAIAAETLRAKAECQRLFERFRAAKLPLLFLKGLTVGALAYRNPGIKSAVDIDLLIDPNDLNQAAEILCECGYEIAYPRNVGLNELQRTWKESDWLRKGSAFQIDLHTRTADNPRLIPAITVHSSSRPVDVGDGISLPTLAGDELFAYLAVHGASSAWFRLKWLSDFAALLAAKSTTEVERLYRRSQELGAGRAAGQALLLADALFGSLQSSPQLRDELSSDPMTRLLFRTALNQVTGEAVEPTEHRFGTIAIHWTQFLLLPGLRYKASEFIGQGSRILSRF